MKDKRETKRKRKKERESGITPLPPVPLLSPKP
jgi:hypothetical protein